MLYKHRGQIYCDADAMQEQLKQRVEQIAARRPLLVIDEADLLLMVILRRRTLI